jgi:hypothetical protein
MTLGDIIQQKYDETYRRKNNILKQLLQLHENIKSRMTQPTKHELKDVHFNILLSGKLEIFLTGNVFDATELFELSKNKTIARNDKQLVQFFTNLIMNCDNNVKTRFDLPINDLTLHFKSAHIISQNPKQIGFKYAK